jgi:crotonobetainyl-CoA:carnitine CoA-transferase CaiB-like acyl-CoA transferase
MDRSEVEQAVRLGGLDLPPDADYEVIGSDPILRSPHYLGNGAAVARLLTGIAANELWRVRTGGSQSIAVDARHAAAALRSFQHIKYFDPDKQQPARGTRSMRVMGIVPARDDRYVQLHGSFNDGPQILEELGLDETASQEDIAAAVKRRDAFELEASFIRRRVCGGVVMTKEEWAAHPQGRATADWPVVRITKIGDSPREPLPDGDRPASGVRVLDLTRVLAGPTCAKTIAEHGADVLHITAPHLGGDGGFETETGIGKRQAKVDLNVPEEAGVMRDLIAGADVFSQGYRLGTVARRGFAPEQVAALRPGIVYVSENCYGHTGPWAERPGWEQLGQAATGMSFREGQASSAGVPRLAPAAVNDYSTGFFAAYGAMMALARRAMQGGSWHVQVSLSQTCTWYQRLGDDNDKDNADAGDITPFLAEMDTPHFGRIQYLAPALSMSQTPPRWELPPVLHGTHDPAWLPR